VQPLGPRVARRIRMTYSQHLLTETWENQLTVARYVAKVAGNAIIDQFGSRAIRTVKGIHDVQLRADVIAQEAIISRLLDEYPAYGIVAEEETFGRWPDDDIIWAVDPLDGTNNFGYGIAHCAVAISLFRGESVVLALVSDFLTGREFYATQGQPLAPCQVIEVPLRHATVSLVTSYSSEGQVWGSRFNEWFGARCKRVTSLWAPALDLALIATGAIDAMVCYGADLLDVCGGMFLVQTAGGRVVDLSGEPLKACRSMHARPVSFIAARNVSLARELVENLRLFNEVTG